MPSSRGVYYDPDTYILRKDGTIIVGADVNADVPANSTILGAGATHNSVETTPQVVLGSTVNRTTVVNASTNISLKINNTTVLTATSSSVTSTPVLKSNIFQLSTGGGMIVNSSGWALNAPGSFHISGAYAGEIRRIPISPFRLIGDDDGQINGAVVADSGDDPFTATAFSQPWITGVRLSAQAAEGYIYLPQVPEFWRATHIFIGAVNKFTSLVKAEDIAVISRSHVFTGTNILTRHLALTTGDTGTNREVQLTTPLVNNGSNYGVCYIDLDTTATTFIGGYLVISRI